MPKVSVVVATYCTPKDGLKRVIDSLDRQTLPQSEFESIFVDDGSTDDTADRLRRLAESRPNMRVIEIENSGWASKPRNVGIEAARGDYVVFMDHDDSLFPEALARTSEFGLRHGSDLVNAREVRSSGIAWAWDVYVADIGGDDTPKSPEMVQPMLPHKFYRREFLISHGIRFPEGRRVLWEDNYFNVEVYARAKVISVLGSVPAYLWHVETGSANSSKTFARDLDEYWQKLGELFDFFDKTLESEQDLAWFRLRYFRIRVLTQWLGPTLLTRAAHRTQRALELIPDFVRQHVPEELDERLPKLFQARAALVRQGAMDLLRPLAEEDEGTTATGTVHEIAWDPNGRLVVTCKASWHRGTGDLPLFRQADGRLHRVLPGALAAALPQSVQEVSDQLATATSDVTYHLRGKGQPEIGVESVAEVTANPQTSEAAVVTHAVVATLDPDRNSYGQPLTEGTYDFSLRVGFMGMLAHSRLRSQHIVRPALVNGRAAIAYSDRSDRLALQFGAQLHRLFDTTSPDVDRVLVVREGWARYQLRIPVEGLDVRGDTSLACSVQLRSVTEDGVLHRFPAVLLGRDGGAWVQTSVRAWPGRYLVELYDAPSDRIWTTPLMAVVGRSWRLTVRRAKKPPLASSLWGATAEG